MHLQAHAHPTRSKKAPVALLAGVLVILLLSGCIDPMEPAEEGSSRDAPEQDPGPSGSDQGDGDAAGEHPPDPDDQQAGQEEDDEEGDEAEGNETDDPDDGQDDQEGEDEGDGGDEDQDEGADEEEQAPQWPEPQEATLRPGVRVYTGEQVQGVDLHCTTNFLFQTADGTFLLGTAAACIDGYDLGDEVPIRDLETTGTLAYSGWWDGQAHDSTHGHDFALIALGDEERPDAHPAVYHYGGPAAIADPAGLEALDQVVWYGNSTQAPEGLGEGGEGYVCNVTAEVAYVHPVGPVTSFDHGAGVMDSDGNASGILTGTTVEDDTCGVAVRVEPLQDSLAQARARGMDVQLVPWTLLQDGLLPTVPP